MQAVLESGSGRDINRHKYTEEEAQEALKQPVVKALLDLCKFRNTHQAFMGQVCFPRPPPPPCRLLQLVSHTQHLCQTTSGCVGCHQGSVVEGTKNMFGHSAVVEPGCEQASMHGHCCLGVHACAGTCLKHQV